MFKETKYKCVCETRLPKTAKILLSPVLDPQN